MVEVTAYSLIGELRHRERHSLKRVTASYSLLEFFARLRRAEKRALLLDYDGTLAPFKVKPEDALPYPGLQKELNRFLISDHTRLVIISGRPVHTLLPLLNLVSNTEIWGTHGLERLQPDGAYSVEQLSKNALSGLKEAQCWFEREKLESYCEHKLAGIAVHTRGLSGPVADETVERILKGLSPLAKNSGLVLQRFDGGVELRVKSIHKGVAVRTILDELGKDGFAAYLGDDLTDEDAFGAIKGRGLGVLVREVFRPTIADLWLKPPKELLEFLEAWLQFLGGETCPDKRNGD
jgi:trehalose 6-phosphate phosphatase